MLDAGRAGEFNHADDAAGGRAEATTETAALLRLTQGDVLIPQGAEKGDLYRVLSGALCGIASIPASLPQTATFYFTGDIVGIGRLATYVWSVVATSDAVVSRLPASALDSIMACEPQIADRQAEITDTEFATLRRQLTASAHDDRMRALANLLIVLSRTNGYEGREPGIVLDDVSSGAVATQLGLPVDELATALTGLQTRGLVATSPKGGLRICDTKALEQFADAV